MIIKATLFIAKAGNWLLIIFISKESCISINECGKPESSVFRDQPLIRTKFLGLKVVPIIEVCCICFNNQIDAWAPVPHLIDISA